MRSQYDSNTGDVATDETGTRSVNRVDFSMKWGVHISSQDAFVTIQYNTIFVY